LLTAIAVLGVATVVGGFPQNRGTGQPADSLQETPMEMFNRSDADKDERLTFDEFLHTDLLYEQLKRDEFNALDADRDGIVTREEYENHVRREKEHGDSTKAEYFKQLFEQFDEDNDMKLSPKEVENVLQKRFLVKPKDPVKFKDLFDSHDSNGDGGLDLNEYLRFDAVLPFAEFNPTTDEVVSPPPERQVQMDDVDQAGHGEHPVITLKTEKLPMMKSNQFPLLKMF